MNDLLPYAHCGFRKPRLITTDDGRHLVKCQCGMSTGPHKKESRAINLWNSRVWYHDDK